MVSDLVPHVPLLSNLERAVENIRQILFIYRFQTSEAPIIEIFKRFCLLKSFHNSWTINLGCFKYLQKGQCICYSFSWFVNEEAVFIRILVNSLEPGWVNFFCYSSNWLHLLYKWLFYICYELSISLSFTVFVAWVLKSHLFL